MSHTLSEDDLYRTSSQYRLWSFSPESLAALRKKTHDIAIERARRYTGDSSVEDDGTASVEYLTEEEEVRLVQRYCDVIRSTCKHLDWPVQVKATAIQYLKRFYLSNSCMTYPPKEIYKTVLFLASKTEAIHVTVSSYARSISTDPEQVLAPEYKVMQALRFTLDVRHPFRGLKGVLMEMLNMVDGKMGVVKGGVDVDGKVAETDMKQLPPPLKSNRSPWRAREIGDASDAQLKDRVEKAYGAAKTLLDAPALLTDVYFLYTPSQMLMAALFLADEPLLSFYLSIKVSTASSDLPQILATLSACAEMLAAFEQSTVLTKEARASLEEKLERCRDPSTRDLIKAFAAMKQGGIDDGKVDETVAKRRKLEREKNEKAGDDLFGPSLAKPA